MESGIVIRLQENSLTLIDAIAMGTGVMIDTGNYSSG